MTTTIYYLSATGNSLYMARRIQQQLEQTGQVVRLVSIAKALREQDLCPAGRVGFVMPLHFFGLPLLGEEFLTRLDLSQVTYSFLVMTCGWHYMSDAFHAVRRLFAAQGGKLSAAFYVDMVSVYLPLGDIPPEAKKNHRLQKAAVRIEKVAEAIMHEQSSYDREYLNVVSGLIHSYVRKHRQELDQDFRAGESCNQCGLCAKICPVANIHLGETGPVWQHHCTQCLACLHICPQKTIELGKTTIGRQRYHHPEIRSNELFEKRGD